MGLSERLAALTTLTSSLEYLTQRKEIRKGGLNNWATGRESSALSSPLTRKALDIVSSEKATIALHLARTAVSAGMLLPGNSRWRGAGSLFLGASSLALYPRHRYGTDGSDQVSALVQTATGAARLSRSPQTQDALLWYVALQANLSYTVSGWIKLLGRPWLDATALGGVMRTRTYGHEGAYRLTQKYPRAARYLTHGVLALECLFPLAYLGGGRLARPMIASAGAFHIANGFLMGLGRFVTSFTAMHPAVAYTSTPRHHPAVAGRDDRALAAAATALAAAAAASGILAVQRRLRAVEGQPGTQSLTTRHSNELRYELRPAGAGQPLLVFAHGMISTSEHFSWIIDALRKDSKYGILTYARAGYAGSQRHSPTHYHLGESVDDLIDLVHAHAEEDQSVVLVGHSLGGELARRAAAELGDRVHAVVYLDSSHPEELNRSKQQDDSAKRVSKALTIVKLSLQGGLGVLMPRPAWVEELPPYARERAFAQLADARLWSAGIREWNAVEEEFRAFHEPLPALATDALVISAQQTVDRDAEQLLMHNELAEAHRGEGRHVETVVVDESTHDSLLTNAQYGTEVAATIRKFLSAAAAATANALAPVPASASASARKGAEK